MTKPFFVFLPAGNRRSLSEDELTAQVRARLNSAPLPPHRHFMNELRRVSPWQLPINATSRDSNVELAMPLLVELARSFQVDRDVHDSRLEVIEDPSMLSVPNSFHGEPQPRAGVVYVRHPHDARLLLRMAEFHTYLLAEKREEFEILVASLGGRSIRIEEQDGTSRDGFVGGRFSEGEEKVSLGGGAGRETSTTFSLKADFGPPPAPPRVPEKLRWLPVEPDWRAMATNRLEGRELLSRAVEFRYSTDFSVTAGLAATFEGLGLDIGGTFEEARKLARKCTVEFWPLAGSETARR